MSKKAQSHFIPVLDLRRVRVVQNRLERRAEGRRRHESSVDRRRQLDDAGRGHRRHRQRRRRRDASNASVRYCRVIVM